MRRRGTRALWQNFALTGGKEVLSMLGGSMTESLATALQARAKPVTEARFPLERKDAETAGPVRGGTMLTIRQALPGRRYQGCVGGRAAGAAAVHVTPESAESASGTVFTTNRAPALHLPRKQRRSRNQAHALAARRRPTSTFSRVYQATDQGALVPGATARTRNGVVRSCWSFGHQETVRNGYATSTKRQEAHSDEPGATLRGGTVLAPRPTLSGRHHSSGVGRLLRQPDSADQAILMLSQWADAIQRLAMSDRPRRITYGGAEARRIRFTVDCGSHITRTPTCPHQRGFVVAAMPHSRWSARLKSATLGTGMPRRAGGTPSSPVSRMNSSTAAGGGRRTNIYGGIRRPAPQT